MLDLCVRRIRPNALQLSLASVLIGLVALLYATDRRLGLHEFASNRCRFHAIPVAVSVLYHNRPHDYTADRSLAMRFQDTTHQLAPLIRAAIREPHDHTGTYFWVADDRGLADYVIGAFHLFGPKTRSLSKFYFLTLSLSLALFVIGYWRSPAALLLPVFGMLTWLGIAQVLLYPMPFPSEQGVWAEQIPLYESRMFDVLALVAVLHLAVLSSGLSVSRATWITAIPQATLLVFLYHARSSIGWQYLGLFTLIGIRVSWWAALRFRSRESCREALARPILVGVLLGTSLVGLKQYQHLVYHPDYINDHGQRTFWHNALMGLQFHPRLQTELPMRSCDDNAAVELVLRKMFGSDPNLDQDQWNKTKALNSLGNHNSFDWDRYESTAHDIYLDLWRSQPHDMIACYGVFKPVEIARLAGRLGKRLTTAIWSGKAWEFLGGLVLLCAAMVGMVRVARRDARIRSEMLSLAGLAATLLPFSLIPGIAFYPAIITVACFFLLSAMVGGLGMVFILSRTKELA